MAFDNKEREELRRKFHDYAKSRDRSLRDELVTAHMGLAEYLARRFTNRGEPLDDLVQVAALGLLKAVGEPPAALHGELVSVEEVAQGDRARAGTPADHREAHLVDGDA
ncbi:MAG TPA: sigma factor, partial [Acidimicrobiales bacterium]|nr:sigma factor [Acidimicrobiales bacterium]